jgi:hypothetical protein
MVNESVESRQFHDFQQMHMEKEDSIKGLFYSVMSSRLSLSTSVFQPIHTANLFLPISLGSIITQQ